MTTHRKAYSWSIVTLAWSMLVFMMVAVTLPAHAGTGSERVYGKTYGEWSAKWWQWANSIPASESPVVLEGEVDCTLGQQGPVYFLAGKAISLPDDPDEFPIVLTGERTCTIPRGKALFFPLVNVEFINVEDETFTVEEKREALDAFIVGARNFCGASATLDALPPYEIPTVRVQSPPYTLVIGEDNLFGNPVGTVDNEVVSDGFWMMVPPLPEGSHVLSFEGSFCVPEDDTDPSSPLVPFFSVEMTYDLTVDN